MDCAINIGNQANTLGGPEELAKALVAIMQTGVEQETIREAIRAFSKIVKIENVVLEGANIDARTINV